MAGPARRSFYIPSRFLFTRRVSTSCSGVEAFDPPPLVHSRRVVVTGKHSVSVFLCVWVCFRIGPFLFIFYFFI